MMPTSYIAAVLPVVIAIYILIGQTHRGLVDAGSNSAIFRSAVYCRIGCYFETSGRYQTKTIRGLVSFYGRPM